MMKKPYLWTSLGARLQHIKCRRGYPYNWLFLPGGPGLGSESLANLTAALELPGTMWYLDLPGDGSNVSTSNKDSFKKWPEALIEATKCMQNAILVAHSTGGMYTLATPELEDTLAGLVLMDSAPNASWQQTFAETIMRFPITNLDVLEKLYRQNSCNATLKDLTVASAPYLFTKKSLQKGVELLKSLPYNYETCQWSEENFDSTFQAQWTPLNIPTLIFAGKEDLLTPLKLFQDEKRFHRKNIMMEQVENAAHYPWIDNAALVTHLFEKYCKMLAATEEAS